MRASSPRPSLEKAKHSESIAPIGRGYLSFCATRWLGEAGIDGIKGQVVGILRGARSFREVLQSAGVTAAALCDDEGMEHADDANHPAWEHLPPIAARREAGPAAERADEVGGIFVAQLEADVSHPVGGARR